MRSYEITSKVEVRSMEELSQTDRELVLKARESTKRSYAPYSHFCVGAAALLSNGVIVEGSNQENAAYPSGLCAERTALFSANSRYPDAAVVALAVAACYDNHFVEEPVPPCGACRQVMLEVEDRYSQPMRILLCGAQEIHILESVRSLLPFQFTGSSMK